MREIKPISHLATRLAKRVKVETGFDVVPKITRTYAGRDQKSAGTWSWSMEFVGAGMIGSQFTAKECVQASKWSTYLYGTNDIEITSIELANKESSDG